MTFSFAQGTSKGKDLAADFCAQSIASRASDASTNRDTDLTGSNENLIRQYADTRPTFPYNPAMALVVFLRGVNVGGHRRFRPSILARELNDYDVVNVGAAGTLVVRKPGPRAKFRAELLRKLPFETEVMVCDSRDIVRLETESPFGAEPPRPDVVRFVSILSKAGGLRASLPILLPSEGEWLVRLIGSKDQFVFGMYRRHMKTIGYLSQIDKLFGVPATTRNWNTILTIVEILKGEGLKGRGKKGPRPATR